MKAPTPENEVARLEALQRYAILDTFPEQEFDDLSRLAALIWLAWWMQIGSGSKRKSELMRPKRRATLRSAGTQLCNGM
jgi:hypothetical protein